MTSVSFEFHLMFILRALLKTVFLLFPLLLFLSSNLMTNASEVVAPQSTLAYNAPTVFAGLGNSFMTSTSQSPAILRQPEIKIKRIISSVLFNTLCLHLNYVFYQVFIDQAPAFALRLVYCCSVPVIRPRMKDFFCCMSGLINAGRL